MHSHVVGTALLNHVLDLAQSLPAVKKVSLYAWIN